MVVCQHRCPVARPALRNIVDEASTDGPIPACRRLRMTSAVGDEYSRFPPRAQRPRYPDTFDSIVRTMAPACPVPWALHASTSMTTLLSTARVRWHDSA